MFARFGPVSHARTRNALFPFGSGGDLFDLWIPERKRRTPTQRPPRVTTDTTHEILHVPHTLLLATTVIGATIIVIALLPVHIRRKGTEYSVSNLQSSPVLHLPTLPG